MSEIHLALRVGAFVAACGVLGVQPGCSESSSPNKDVVPDSGYGTDSLDALGGATSEPTPEPEPEEPVVIDQGVDERTAEEEREWERARESQSLLGRSRDQAKTLGNSIQGGTDEPENGLAVTHPDDEWVGTSGWAWDMPQGWQMAIPGSGRFGEMYIASATGAGTVTFVRDSASAEQLERQVGGMVVDLIGSKVSPRTQRFEVEGHAVTLLSLEGTYIDPSGKGGGNEKPFYAVRGAVIDLGDARVQIVLLGPEDTVRAHEARFESMVRGMRAR